MTYNFGLYHDFCSVAEELGIELHSKNGSCIYLVLPHNLNQRYWAMLWTPLNRLNDLDRNDSWQDKLEYLEEQSDADFHLEFDTKNYDYGSYWMFPEVNNKPRQDVTREDIKVCVERMLDEANFEQHVIMARLREPQD